MLDAAPAPTSGGASTRVGVDVGGTKTHVAVVLPDGRRLDTVVPSDTWRQGSLFSTPANFDRLAAVVDAAVPGGGGLDGRLVLGLHGVDTPAQRDAASAELAGRARGPVLVLNDAQLLGPAAGHRHCVALIVGTGAVAVGTDADGRTISADGHGALLSDHGSAPALVRETVRAALRLADWEGPDAAFADPAVRSLCDAYAVGTVQDLALAVSEQRPFAWGVHAPLVFDAAAAGSSLAAEVLHGAADVLAANVAAVHRRGARGDAVVAAGGVVTAQPLLQDLLRAGLARHAPHLTLDVLTVAPVEGALALAGAL
ncbi:N-acetylglucosamine kinase-like BadF-type ATPase [Cellulomonas sp. SLBN-39]|nr:N-acetylglucosamine kinase-like BadF-type ATPase [Cellulomonas sp. SLBN-39]